jgi:hypothetical protein
VYKGEWKDGEMNGKGKYTYSSGNMYEGVWKDGKRHGKFIFRAKSRRCSLQFEEGVEISRTIETVQPEEGSCVIM